ncbi:MAG: DUF882 domain-containing protein [Pseudomonadota bacterium]
MRAEPGRVLTMADRFLSDPTAGLPPIRKREPKAPRARLRILIAGDPSRPMRTISLPRALPLVLSLIGACLVVATVLLACGSWKMSDARTSLERRVRAMMQAAHSVALGTANANSGDMAGANMPPARAPSGEMGHFTLDSVNTHEQIEIALNLETGEVDAETYRRLRHVMRCLHTTAETPIDPRLIDLLYRISQRTKQKILLVSGFRAPMYSKAALSYHTRGMAADIRIPGMTALMARDLAESMGVRGLGYYPVSGFIHVDVRDNRTRWTDYGQDRQETETTEHGPDHDEGSEGGASASVNLVEIAPVK